MVLSPGSRLGVYDIVGHLGQGGMGEVYRALDTRLGREIALKVLPAEVATDKDRLARFNREARAAAALNHPNVVTLYSVEESDGVHFLTMELVDGQPLQQLIPAEGFSAERVIELATAIAEAIGAAHGKGLIHRDLKPANIMVTRDGRVKVLDFGLAKELRSSLPDEGTLTSFDQTQAGIVMGTPAYMSPEQVAGAALDHRTDIFSLGVILYEMATGRRPFQGTSQVELAASILRDPLPALGKASVPAELTSVIEHCLAKRAGDRIQTAVQLASELRAARGSAPSAHHAATREQQGFRVAVLPFKASGASPELLALSEGLSEEIVAGLSRFSYLRMMTTGSGGAQYVLEGSLRQAGSQVRVSMQLTDTTTGAHLWADNYTRTYSPDAIFEIQDSLVPTIVSTLGDTTGVLRHSMWIALRDRDPATLNPYEALLRSNGFNEQLTVDEYEPAVVGLTRAIEQEPRHSDCLATLAVVYANAHLLDFGSDEKVLDSSLSCARRAVAAEPSNNNAHYALAVAHWCRKEFAAFRSAADRALTLNPMDGSVAGGVGLFACYSGDWQRGCELIERAMRLNPRHAGWYWYPFVHNAYRQGDYPRALDYALRLNLPGQFWTHLVFAMVHGQLGNLDAAADALGDLIALKPDFPVTANRLLGKFFDDAYSERVLDGLRKAGLVLAGEPAPGAGSGSVTVQPATTTALRPSVAVLPFANLSADKEQEYFSDGLAEEIISLLAQVPGLKVIARTSSFAFRGRDEDVRSIAKTLDVTHVLEGSVRRAGGRIRVTAQLIAAVDGGQVWSERFDRELSDIFAVQDEIAAAMTAALRVKLSAAAAPQRYAPAFAAYDAYLKAKHHDARVSPASMELAKSCYESAIALDPAFALAHVGVGSYWLGQTFFGGCPTREAITAARAASRRALQIDESLPEAHALLGYAAALYDLDWDAAERHFSVPMAQQVGFPLLRPIYGGVLFFRGRVDRAIALARQAVEADPLEVWPRMNLHAYLQAAGQDREAYAQAKRVLELDENLVVARVSVTHFHADWGELPEAVAAARKAYAVGPWYPDAVATLAALLRQTGEENEARALYESLGTGETGGEARAQAVYYLMCGEVDTAADWVEKALIERDNSMMYYLRFVISRQLRASHRWPAIAHMLNLPGGSLIQD